MDREFVYRIMYVIHTLEPDQVVTLADLSDMFGVEKQRVRYYLMKYTRKNVLCCIKHGRSTYFTKHYAKEAFVELVQRLNIKSRIM